MQVRALVRSSVRCCFPKSRGLFKSKHVRFLAAKSGEKESAPAAAKDEKPPVPLQRRGGFDYDEDEFFDEEGEGEDEETDVPVYPWDDEDYEFPELPFSTVEELDKIFNESQPEKDCEFEFYTTYIFFYAIIPGGAWKSVQLLESLGQKGIKFEESFFRTYVDLLCSLEDPRPVVLLADLYISEKLNIGLNAEIVADLMLIMEEMSLPHTLIAIWETYRLKCVLNDEVCPFILEEDDEDEEDAFEDFRLVLPAYAAAGRFDKVEDFFGKVSFKDTVAFEIAVAMMIPTLRYPEFRVAQGTYEYLSRFSYELFLECIRLNMVPTTKMVHYTIIFAGRALNTNRVMRVYLSARSFIEKLPVFTFDAVYKSVERTQDLDALQLVINELCPAEEKARYLFLLMRQLMFRRLYDQAAPLFRELVTVGKVPDFKLFQTVFRGLLVSGNIRTARNLYLDMKKIGVNFLPETDLMVITELQKAGHSTKNIKISPPPEVTNEENQEEVKVDQVSEL